jgi:hypothetical protein
MRLNGNIVSRLYHFAILQTHRVSLDYLFCASLRNRNSLFDGGEEGCSGGILKLGIEDILMLVG